MTYVIYLFAGLFIVLAATMLYVFYRSSHFGMFLMGTTYAASGVMAFWLVEWWPLVVGFALAWVLRYLGLELRVGPTGESGGARDEGKR